MKKEKRLFILESMEDLKLMTDGELMFLGLANLVYVRNSKENGKDVVSVYAADGTSLAIVESEIEARALVSKKDMQIVSLH